MKRALWRDMSDKIKNQLQEKETIEELEIKKYIICMYLIFSTSKN